MKVLNYIAVLAVLSVGGMLGAQTPAPAASAPQAAGAANGIRVQAAVNDKEVSVKVDADSHGLLVSSKDMLKKVVAEALKAIGADTHQGKVFNALMVAVESSMGDPNTPAEGPISLALSIKPESDNVYNSNLAFEMNGVKFASDAKSTVNPDQSVTTTGNVTVTSPDGVSKTNPVLLATSADGVVTGSVGSASVADKTVGAAASEAVVQTQSKTDALETSGSSSNVIPDNTLVSSGQE